MKLKAKILSTQTVHDIFEINFLEGWAELSECTHPVLLDNIELFEEKPEKEACEILMDRLYANLTEQQKKEYNYLTVDKDGEVCLYHDHPILDGNIWLTAECSFSYESLGYEEEVVSDDNYLAELMIRKIDK